MDLDKYDEFYARLARGERVSRHEHEIPPETMAELERLDIIERDDEGYHIAGPMFNLWELF
ncbi:hypothetical protein [Halogeometricum sp. CBA1124]|uniref:hypothetical protein n=1 Tax=Halogeometricum sp. CBA1124 TaxID=2668071 RepID=UPI00142C408F|nr:hypothetical protein [Halogeometricum sp. CBA1124]MUV56241.1 hypothetical protein [Halogeometricum sp. CBA1124]